MNRSAELRELRDNLKQAIANHEACKNSYFWRPGSSASQRRSNERKRNFEYKNDRYKITVENQYSESCKNVYYKGYFIIDGHCTNVTKIKNIIAALDTIC